MEEPRHQRGPQRLSHYPHYQQRRGNLQAWVIEALIGAASSFCPPPQFQFVSGQLNLLQPSALFRDKVSLRRPHFRFSPGQITSIRAWPPPFLLVICHDSELIYPACELSVPVNATSHYPSSQPADAQCLPLPPLLPLALSYKRPFSIRQRQYLFQSIKQDVLLDGTNLPSRWLRHLG